MRDHEHDRVRQSDLGDCRHDRDRRQIDPLPIVDQDQHGLLCMRLGGLDRAFEERKPACGWIDGLTVQAMAPAQRCRFFGEETFTITAAEGADHAVWVRLFEFGRSGRPDVQPIPSGRIEGRRQHGRLPDPSLAVQSQHRTRADRGTIIERAEEPLFDIVPRPPRHPPRQSCDCARRHSALGCPTTVEQAHEISLMIASPLSLCQAACFVGRRRVISASASPRNPRLGVWVPAKSLGLRARFASSQSRPTDGTQARS